MRPARGEGRPGFTHVGAGGQARMVDVSPKEPTRRRALAEAVVRMRAETLDALVAGTLRKGSPLEVVRIAGIQAAKRTAELIPLCHPVRLDAVDVRVRVEPPRIVRLEAEAAGTDRTGVEMEAMTAVSLAALALYDMLKSAERGIEITRVVLLEKEGGRSGRWRRSGRCAPDRRTRRTSTPGRRVAGRSAS